MTEVTKHVRMQAIYKYFQVLVFKGFPGGSEVKASTWVRSLGREDPLEKEMATHFSTLAWRIPWREEPGRLQSKELDTTERLHFHFPEMIHDKHENSKDRRECMVQALCPRIPSSFLLFLSPLFPCFS